MSPEIEKWRTEAEKALKQANFYLQRILYASSELLRLTVIHVPNDFAHCEACKVPWPCETAIVIKDMAEMFQEKPPED